jgi:hypothetical protein
MSLVTCKDCKKAFSTDAKRCPHCGARKPGRIGCLPFVIISAALLTWAILAPNHPESTIAAPTLTPADEAKLLHIIRDTIEIGVIKNASLSSDGQYLGVVVRPSFNALEFDTKLNLSQVLWRYYDAQAGHRLVVLVFTDSLTNKEIGTYSHDVGLRLD